MAATDADRFNSFVREESSGCLVWSGGTTKKGYGVFWADGKWILAHRWAFHERYGWMPEAVLHACDNPPCVRHLVAGTRGENNSDRARKGRNDDRSGEGNPACKLTDEQVEEIKSRYATGNYTQANLAKLYEISAGHISYLVNEKRGKRGKR